jgi:hypothetical protein
MRADRISPYTPSRDIAPREEIGFSECEDFTLSNKGSGSGTDWQAALQSGVFDTQSFPPRSVLKGGVDPKMSIPPSESSIVIDDSSSTPDCWISRLWRPIDRDVIDSEGTPYVLWRYGVILLIMLCFFLIPCYLTEVCCVSRVVKNLIFAFEAAGDLRVWYHCLRCE